MGLGGVLKSKSIMAAPFTGGTSLLGNGKVKDLLFGAKTPATPDEVIDLGSAQGRALQERLLGGYGDVLDNGVQSQMDLQERQARANAADQERKAQEMVAQRGLGNSSLGLSAVLNAHRDLGNQVGAIRASAPILKQQNLQFATGGINSIMNEQGQSKIFKQGTPAQGRGGGLVGALAPIAGSAAGAYFGGPGGAAMASRMFSKPAADLGPNPTGG